MEKLSYFEFFLNNSGGLGGRINFNQVKHTDV